MSYKTLNLKPLHRGSFYKEGSRSVWFRILGVKLLCRAYFLKVI